MFEAAGKYGRGRPSIKERRRLGVAVLLAGSLWMSSAQAQPEPTAEETAAARALALEGIKLADAGRCEEAIERLARAERLHHAPVVLGRLGECQIARGRLVQGTETLRKVLREPLPPNPPQVVLDARERAQEVLDKTKGKIGALKIVVRGPEDMARVNVSVDGEPMNGALLDVERPTDPGDHLIEASAVGYSSASARVSVGQGTRQQVVIELVPDPLATNVEPAPSVAPSAPQPGLGGDRLTPGVEADAGEVRVEATTGERAARAPDHTAAYVAWAGAGAAAVAGSILGLMAIDRKNDLIAECPDNRCPATSRDRLDSARGMGTAATISFIVSGAAAGLGVFLYFTADPTSGDSGKNEVAARSLRPTPRGNALRAEIGLRGIQLSGDF